MALVVVCLIFDQLRTVVLPTDIAGESSTVWVANLHVASRTLYQLLEKCVKYFFMKTGLSLYRLIDLECP